MGVSLRGMKRAGLILGLVLVAAIAAGAVFIATFDADRYRPLLVQKAEELIGRPVQVDRLSLGWRQGLALQLGGLAIYQDAAHPEPIVQIHTVSAVLRLLPLLRKQVKVSSVVLREPRVHVSRDAHGRINLLGLAVVGGAAAASQRQPPRSSPAGLLEIDSLRIQDGTVRWRDVMATPPVDVVVRDVDLAVRHLASRAPAAFQLRLALFSDVQNLLIQGRLRPPTDTSPAAVEAFRLEAKLSSVRLDALTQAIPALQPLRLKERLGGDFTVLADRVILDPRAVGELQARVRLTDGSLTFAGLGSQPTQITVEATADAGRIQVTTCRGHLAGGSVECSAEVEAIAAQPAVTFRVSATDLSVQALLPPEDASQASLHGVFSGSFAGRASLQPWPPAHQTVAGRGELTLRDGVIVNLNLLREVFERLTIIPGLTQRLQARLPPDYQEKFNAPDTRLEPVQVPIAVQGGVLTFEALQVRSDTFELQGAGRVGLEGAWTVDTVLRVDPVLSEAIIASVNELQHLRDAEGRLELPVGVHGTGSRIASVLPDLQYVASRLVVSKAQEWLGDLLQRQLQRSEPGPAP